MISIFVGNLDYNASESDVRSLFEPHGRVSSVRIMSDPTTHRSRGFAFVSMPSLDDADEAIRRLSGISLHGRRLTINESQDGRRDGIRVSPGCNSGRSRALEMFDALCQE
ncbi:RNA-binding protein [bacterium]|nr:RNA-binding protein [bacterium]